MREQSFVKARIPHRRVEQRCPRLRPALSIGAYLGCDLPPDPQHGAVEGCCELLGREAREDLANVDQAQHHVVDDVVSHGQRLGRHDAVPAHAANTAESERVEHHLDCQLVGDHVEHAGDQWDRPRVRRQHGSDGHPSSEER